MRYTIEFMFQMNGEKDLWSTAHNLMRSFSTEEGPPLLPEVGESVMDHTESYWYVKERIFQYIPADDVVDYLDYTGPWAIIYLYLTKEQPDA